MITNLSSATRLSNAPAPAPSAPAAPAPAAGPHDTVKIVGGTLASAAFCGASSAVLCGVGAGIAAIAGLPFVGAGAVVAAIGISAAFGGALSGLTLKNSFTPPAGTDDAFKTGRGPVLSRLPDPPRDAASMVLAEHTIWQSLDDAKKAATAKDAARIGSEGFARFGTLLTHGAFRTSSLVLGVAVGMSVAGPLVGIPLGLLGGFAASYVIDKPGHWLGEAAGRGVGAIAGRIAYSQAN